MDAVFHALASGARRRMLRRLAEGQLTVGELAEPVGAENLSCLCELR